MRGGYRGDYVVAPAPVSSTTTSASVVERVRIRIPLVRERSAELLRVKILRSRDPNTKGTPQDLRRGRTGSSPRAQDFRSRVCSACDRHQGDRSGRSPTVALTSLCTSMNKLLCNDSTARVRIFSFLFTPSSVPRPVALSVPFGARTGNSLLPSLSLSIARGKGSQTVARANRAFPSHT